MLARTTCIDSQAGLALFRSELSACIFPSCGSAGARALLSRACENAPRAFLGGAEAKGRSADNAAAASARSSSLRLPSSASGRWSFRSFRRHKNSTPSDFERTYFFNYGVRGARDTSEVASFHDLRHAPTGCLTDMTQKTKGPIIISLCKFFGAPKKGFTAIVAVFDRPLLRTNPRYAHAQKDMPRMRMTMQVLARVLVCCARHRREIAPHSISPAASRTPRCRRRTAQVPGSAGRRAPAAAMTSPARLD